MITHSNCLHYPYELKKLSMCTEMADTEVQSTIFFSGYCLKAA